MKTLTFVLAILVISGCEDRYRYTCQDPKHFQDAECQHPACDFSQTCPEYLVAPIMEKKIEGNPAQVAVQPQQCTANCR